MARARNGEAISSARRTPTARKKLRRFMLAAEKRSDLVAWRRGRAVLGYIEGARVIALAEKLEVTRGAINRWLQWYEAAGVERLVTGKPPGSPRPLSDAQRAELVATIEAGPQASGYLSGVWTGPMIGDVSRSSASGTTTTTCRGSCTSSVSRCSGRVSGSRVRMRTRRQCGCANGFPRSKKPSEAS